MQRHENFLLDRLDSEESAWIAPRLSVVQLERWKIIVQPQAEIDRVYFPHSGILSFLVDLPEGGTIETGMMGRDGVFGATQALDERVSLNRVTVLAPGEASVISASAFCQLAQEHPRFRRLVLAYDQFLFASIQQTAVCNAVHTVRQRCCRWLLRMHHLAGDKLEITQELLAQMMGVRRTSISAIAQELQTAGVIRYQRGRITIRDVESLRHAACGCEGDLRDHFQRMFGTQGAEAAPVHAVRRIGGS